MKSTLTSLSFGRGWDPITGRSSKRDEEVCAFGEAIDEPDEAGFDTGVRSATPSDVAAGEDLGGRLLTLISSFVDSGPEDFDIDRPRPCEAFLVGMTGRSRS